MSSGSPRSFSPLAAALSFFSSGESVRQLAQRSGSNVLVFSAVCAVVDMSSTESLHSLPGEKTPSSYVSLGSSYAPGVPVLGKYEGLLHSLHSEDPSKISLPSVAPSSTVVGYTPSLGSPGLDDASVSATSSARLVPTPETSPTGSSFYSGDAEKAALKHSEDGDFPEGGLRAWLVVFGVRHVQVSSVLKD